MESGAQAILARAGFSVVGLFDRFGPPLFNPDLSA
jgi:hypothetical protein